MPTDDQEIGDKIRRFMMLSNSVKNRLENIMTLSFN